MKNLNYLLLTFFICTGCSNGPDKADPNADFNRDMFDFNMDLDENVLRPAAVGYQCLPDPAQEVISNSLSNLKEPYYCVNYLLAADFENFANSLFRFVINSTIGVLGLLDPAGEVMDLPRRKTSYQETLHSLSVAMGDYIVLPILGSSSNRDLVAEPISWFADPLSYVFGIPIMIGKSVLSAINDRSENMETLDNLKKDSLDPYSTAKSVYVQQYGDESADDSFDEEFADELDEKDAPAPF